MVIVKIRYNTLCDDDHLHWRILVDGIEKLAYSIIIEVPTYTTRDDVWDPNRKEMVNKHHITCEANEVVWKGDVVIIR